jgi:hypothetical protein
MSPCYLGSEDGDIFLAYQLNRLDEVVRVDPAIFMYGTVKTSSTPSLPASGPLPAAQSA